MSRSRSAGVADGQGGINQAIPADDEPTGDIGPLGHDEAVNPFDHAVADLDLAVLAAARVGHTLLEQDFALR